MFLSKSDFNTAMYFHVIDEIEKLLGRNTVRLVPKEDIYAEFKARRRYRP